MIDDAMATPPASEVVRRTWAHRLEVEYATGAAAAELSLWLMQIGASPDLIVAAARVVQEEVDHAARCHRICQMAGCSDARPIARESLALQRDPAAPLEHDVVRGCLRVFCLGETYAVEMLRETRDACTVPEVREVVDRLLADEVGHRTFGFELLGWLLEHDASGELLELVRSELPRLLSGLRRTFGGTGALSVGEAERAWGVLPRTAYQDALDRVEKEVLPARLEAIGVSVTRPAESIEASRVKG
jgi:hypothetical protein